MPAEPPQAHTAAEPIWAGVDRLLARGGEPGLAFHRLEPLAARRLRALGEEPPEELVETERLGTAFALAAGVHLARARAAVDGPLLVVKGPELAALYPDPTLRISRDLDLVVPDPEAAQRALVAAGFVESGDPDFYARAPHCCHLRGRGSRSSWRCTAARTGRCAPTRRRPRSCWRARCRRPPGWTASSRPRPSKHVLILAAHAWTHGPLARARDLLDVALMTRAADPAEVDRLARTWAIEKLWRTTSAVAEALFLGSPPPRPLRGWAKNLAEVRERTVLEQHVARWRCWFDAYPAGPALRASLDEVQEDLSPQPGETWGAKLRRSRRAVRNAFAHKSAHDDGS